MIYTTLLVAAIYFAGLFWLAKWGDSGSARAQAITRHPMVYSLGLAIYCTSWTYFGAVGNAAQGGWSYLPIYLGPMLILVFGYSFIKKIILVSKKQKLTSLADLLASRYGKRRHVAIMVTLIALLATIPYIALQLKALGMSFSIIVSYENEASYSYYSEMVMGATVIMIFFAILFGTRKVDITEYRSGLMLAIAFESVIKLLALVAVGLFAINLDATKITTMTAFAGWESDDFLSLNFITQTFMAAAAFLCLPRQYHVAVVDNENIDHLKVARWSFPLYLIIISLAIIPITQAGLNYFDPAEVNADTFVLALPLMTDNQALSILTFIGGLSASTAMIIVATLALSTMISNDVMLPLLLRNKAELINKRKDYSQHILTIRRLTIVAILVASFFYHQLFSSNAALSNIGLLAFSLVIQIMPVLVGGMYWKRGHSNGVVAGLSAGLITCLLFIVNPDPEVHIGQTDYLVIMVIASLFINTLCYIFFSIQAEPRLVDKIQAAIFINPSSDTQHVSEQATASVTNSDLRILLSTFLGPVRTDSLLADYETVYKTQIVDTDKATPVFAQHCELLLGGVIGSSSSRSIMTAVLQGKKIAFEDMVNFFGETTEALSVNQNILFTSLENLDQGISVINEKLELVAWNKRYLELYDYPKDMIIVGTPIENLIRYNADRGECGPGEINELVNKRIEFLKAGSAHRFLRRRSDGKVIEMVGNPLPHGGFVTSFTDVTEHIETQKALDESNIDLQQRVKDRSREVSEINEALKSEIERRSLVESELTIAKGVAEQANAMKTRFLALASHDILQPLNAAKLYLASIHKSQLDDTNRSIIEKVGHSLNSTETLIQTLLEISRLDEGNIEPEIAPYNLQKLLEPLSEEMAMLAEEKGLRFKSRLHPVLVNTDATYLRRIVQNLASNAIKYTEKGGVILSCRLRADHVKIQIFDSGPGISEHEQIKIFDDFYRMQGQTESGVGLGLGVVARLSALLDAPVSIKSNIGQGSCFEVKLPIYFGEIQEQDEPKTNISRQRLNLTVLSVDDEQVNLDATSSLLNKWGCSATMCQTSEQAFTAIKEINPDIILMDYQLGDDQFNGLELIAELRKLAREDTPAILITALHEKELKLAAQEANVQYLSKPVRPAALRSLLTKLTHT